MEVIKQQLYKYPIRERNKWDKDDFQPLSDYKVSIRLDDGNIIECAGFKMLIKNKIDNHACISSQAGCKFGCKFCSSGKNGYARNLSRIEMLGEVKILLDKLAIKKFDRIIFMGIGEPLDNADEIIKTVKLLSRKNNYYNGVRKMALATVGIPNHLKKLAQYKLPVDVWISLHAADDKKRNELMPVNKASSVSKTVSAALYYSKTVNRPVCINYMVFKGFNDGIVDANNLSKLLNGTEKNFILLITRPNSDYKQYKKASYKDLLSFEKKLINAGIKNEINRFLTAGVAIKAGCGEFIFIPITKAPQQLPRS